MVEKQPRTADEVGKFENILSRYAEARSIFPRLPLSLSKICNAVHRHPARGRVIAAAEDVVLNFMFVHLDFTDIWNGLAPFPRGSDGVTTITMEELSALRRIESVRASITFVLRYRALWDKIMVFLVVLLIPEKYDEYVRSDSRKKRFLKLLTPRLQLRPDTLRALTDLIQSFDDKFRTVEAHGPGRLRKHIYDPKPVLEDMRIELVGYLNVTTVWLHLLAGIFDPEGTRGAVNADLLKHFEPAWSAIRSKISQEPY